MKKLNLKLINDANCLEKLNKPLTIKFKRIICCDFEGTLLQYAEFFDISIHKYKYQGEVNPYAVIVKANIMGVLKLEETKNVSDIYQTILNFIKIRAVHLNDTVIITLDNIEIN